MSSSSQLKVGSFVVPGDALGSEEEFVSGSGAYTTDGIIRAAWWGTVVSDVDASGKNRLNVVNTFEKAEDLVINVGDKVLCRIIRTNHNQAFVDIVTVGDRMLPIMSKGLIRREDISLTDLDKIVVQEQFRGGDIVRAIVISLGDNKHYYLSTAQAGLGVELKTTLVQS